MALLMVRRGRFVLLFSRAPDSAEADSGPVYRQWLSPPPERPARVAAPGRARGRAWKLLANRGCDHAVHDCASWLDPVPAARLRLGGAAGACGGRPGARGGRPLRAVLPEACRGSCRPAGLRSEEHTSELQSLLRT